MIGKDININANINFKMGLLLSVVLGVVIFVSYFDLSILDVNNISWLLEGDRMQHYIGSYAFRQDEWHFPITKTTLISYPEGVSIAYTDSNPLLSVIFKVFRFLFSEEKQFFGWWFLTCWVLQAIFAFLIIEKLTKNILYSLLVVVLLCMMPPMFHRIMHTNLIAFWIILWTIYVFINENYSNRIKEGMFFLIMTIGVLTHAYFLFMSFFISVFWFAYRAFELLKQAEKKELFYFFSRTAIYGIGFLIVLWVFGFFYNGPVHENSNGFGDYSMNMLSPFNPTSSVFSPFLPVLGIKKMQQVEGFQYLGMGIILMYLITSFYIVKSNIKQVIKSKYVLFLSIFLIIGLVLYTEKFPTYHSVIFSGTIVFLFLIVIGILQKTSIKVSLLIIPAMLCWVLALSNIVYLGDQKILNYSIIETGFGSEFFRVVRSSGRFFWVTNIIFLIASLYLIFKYIKRLIYLYFIVILCIGFQIADFSNISKYTETKKGGAINVPKYFQELLSQAKRINFVEVKDFHISLFAIRNKIPINSFYMAHGYGELTQKKLDEQSNLLATRNDALNDSTVYIFKKYKVSSIKSIFEAKVYEYNDELFIMTSNKFNFNDEEKLVAKEELYQEKLHAVISKIKNNSDWYEKVKKEAINRGVTLEEMLERSAIHFIENSH